MTVYGYGTGIKLMYDTYMKWWAGKYCRMAAYDHGDYKLVVDVELVGPPSFVYGDVWLVYGDGKKETVQINKPHRFNGPNIFRPRKKDIAALTVEEYHAQKQAHQKTAQENPVL